MPCARGVFRVRNMSSADHCPAVVTTIEKVRELTQAWQRAGESIVLVPTMGNLHAGHLALVEAANAAGKRTVVSLFVNPMQFGENEDFDTYPRTFNEDLGKLSKFKVDMVFAPSVDVIYPDSLGQTSYVEVPRLSGLLEGEHRPGFFRGVATVVNKLFNIVEPDIALFGEKDYQQIRVIQQMVQDLAMPVDIRSVPTVREADGLAMSSRNNYLDAAQREQAAGLYACLQHLVKAMAEVEDANFEVGHASQELDEKGFRVDYVVVRRQQDLAVPEIGDYQLVVLAAARLGNVRLIDNISFELNDKAKMPVG